MTKTASRIAEQRGIPYLNGESSSPDLTERGYKWFFRTSPNDDTFIENMMQFLDGVKAVPTTKIAVVYENTDFGVNTYKAVEKFAKQYKREVVANIAYSAGSASVTAEVQKLSAAKPDVAIFASYTSDAMLFVRTMREQVRAAGAAGQRRRLHRFALRAGSRTAGAGRAVARCLGQRRGRGQGGAQEDQRHVQGQDGQDLNGNNARSMQGVLVLADAINRAGSTDPEAIRKALAATDLGESQVAMPWDGVKFDAKGQNTKGAGLILELKGAGYQTVWPEKYRSDKSLPTLPFSWK